jgi:hypothetical protein
MQRLRYVLAVAQQVQQQRDSPRGFSAPARTNQGKPPPQLKAAPGTRAQRHIDATDLEYATRPRFPWAADRRGDYNTPATERGSNQKLFDSGRRAR